MFNGFLFMLSRLRGFSGGSLLQTIIWVDPRGRAGGLTFDGGKVCVYTEGKATGCERSLQDKEDRRDVGKKRFSSCQGHGRVRYQMI